MYAVLLLLALNNVAAQEKGNFFGCYSFTNDTKFREFKLSSSATECINTCTESYYKFAFMTLNERCLCSNFLGEQKNSDHCKDCRNCDGSNEVADVFFTGVTMNGPPQRLKVENVTDTAAHVSWDPPESHMGFTSYKVVAHVLYTHSSLKLIDLEWMHSNNTRRSELINLNPGTRYNVSVSAVSSTVDGAVAYVVFETDIGVPDQIPEPEIVAQKGTTMQIKLSPVMNNNGPITSYLIVVVDGDNVQAVQTEYLKSYKQAMDEGFTYYITAELPPEKIFQKLGEFTIGDGNSYGKYYNAPLEPNKQYHIMAGVVSRFDGKEKIAYSQATGRENDVIILQMNNDKEETPILVNILSVAIGVITFLLILGITAFYFLRTHVQNRNRQRLNDNQELTLQGPMINIENSGYISEEDIRPISHYEQLSEQVWTIPRNALTIEHTLLLGIGKFGRVYSGSVTKGETLVQCAVYCIADRKLKSEEKRTMLKELGLVIRSKKHQNVLDLIGTCETVDTLNIVLEYTSITLKELLVNSRVFTGNRVTNLSESQAIDYAIDVANGMEFLHRKKIIHKQLCSIHIYVANGSCAKVGGFGIAKYYKSSNVPDHTRYTAKEIFQGHQPTTKSDVWAFACILWEICALGATPYGNIANNDIPEKIIRGLRLAQLSYIYDNLYQLMLNCWQLDMDERPPFDEIADYLQMLKTDQYLNFVTYQGFQYEPYYSELESSENPVYF